jgi:hypothetical protein
MARPAVLVAVGAALNLALAAGAGVLVVTGDEGEPRDATEWLGDFALGAAWALPAAVALLAGRRGELLAAASLLALLVVPTTFSLSLLLAVPALLYLLAFGTAGGCLTSGGAVVALVVVVLGAGAVALLLGATEGRCWEYEVRSDGSTVSRTVPTEGRWERTDGTVGGSSSTAVLGGDVVEAGGGCEDRTTLLGAVLALALTIAGLVAALAGRGPRLHSPA